MDAKGRDRLATVVIINHNYGCYLRDAVDSALNQTHPGVEVVVVDDASDDGSQAVLATYGNLIRTVLLSENVGQTAAFVAGLQASQGDPVIALDADDALLPTAVATAIDLSRSPDVVKVHWPLLQADEQLRPTGLRHPIDPLPDGDFRSSAAASGPGAVLSPPTSGNAWSRDYLDSVLPAPGEHFRGGFDAYLFGLAPLFGVIRASPEPQAIYRGHPTSSWRSRTFDERLKLAIGRYETLISEYTRWCPRLGFEAQPDRWRARSWFHRLSRAVGELDARVPNGTTFVLIDDFQWNMGPDAARRPLPFLERDGQGWGRPPDSATAIRELERMRRSGAEFAAVAWPAFWWLDYYEEFEYWLRAQHTCVLDTDRLILFDLHA